VERRADASHQPWVIAMYIAPEFTASNDDAGRGARRTEMMRIVR
jgi:hypothetical protein